ncbi:MAG: hypothetical protein ACPL68_04875 [Candidatus Hydrothermia bacterium]
MGFAVPVDEAWFVTAGLQLIPTDGEDVVGERETTEGEREPPI